MRFRFTITNLKWLLLLDLLTVALASGGYFYVQTQFPQAAGPSGPSLKPAEFLATNLKITPTEAGVGQPIAISANITNVGEEASFHAINLTVNDEFRDNETVWLLGGESKTIEFVNVENNTGSYSVKVENLTGTFVISSPATTTSPTTPEEPKTPRPANLNAYGLQVSPAEAWPGDTIGISAKVTNYGDISGSYSAVLTINGLAVGNQTVDLSGGASKPVQFMVNEANTGVYTVVLGTLVGTFNIVPNGMHTLSIASSPYSNTLQFTLDGQSLVLPYSAILPVGLHTIVMPVQDPTATNLFLNWEDGSVNPTRTVDLQSPMQIAAYYTGGGRTGSSCPSLYLWNGKEYVYVQEVSNHGWLGYTRYVNEDGSLEYWRNNPWDYIPINKSQLQLTNGYYMANLTQKWDEIFYLDSAYLVVVDHPTDQNVYSTMTEQYIDPNYVGNIYTVSKYPLKPASAYNELVTVHDGAVVNSYGKVDALSTISSMDGVFTTGFNGKYSQAWNNQTWNRLTLNLGNLAGAQQIKLVVRAIVDWGPTDSYNLWMNKFYSTKVPDHTEPTPIPFLEVRDANGNWVRVPESRQIPMPPDTLARTYVVDLTGLFPTNDYSLRINNFWNVTYDYIGIDTSTQQNVSVQRIAPQAFLRQEFSANSKSSGSFTRYGDVTSILLNEDDEFVIGRQGDSVSLQFPADKLSPLAAGMERDYFFFVACWFKVEYANYGFGAGHNGFTVDPLPFHNMSGFPYPLQTESYPFEANAGYLRDYNTRVINPPSQEASISIWVPVVTVIVLVVVNSAVFVRFRKRGR